MTREGGLRVPLKQMFRSIAASALVAMSTFANGLQDATPSLESLNSAVAALLPAEGGEPKGAPQIFEPPPSALLCAVFPLGSVRVGWYSPTLEFVTSVQPWAGDERDGYQDVTEPYINELGQLEADNRISKLNVFFLNRGNSFAVHLEIRLLAADRPTSQDDRFRRKGDMVIQGCGNHQTGTVWTNCSAWSHLGNMVDSGTTSFCGPSDRKR